MGSWATINNINDRFRLLCNHNDCSLSVCNLISGKLHITTIHGNKRHSVSLTNEDMLFIISQYIKALSPIDREKLLDFYSKF